MKHDLLLTLGHNSSAILVKDGEIVCGYEEERLTGVKSDSRFPINAMHECLGPETDAPELDEIYVTHWAIDGKLSSMSKKHWDPTQLPAHKRLHTLSQDFTHHDAHAHSATWYAYAKPGLGYDDTMIFVIDGFGNFGEHISIYKMSGYGPKLIRRFHGYGGSLGLMYQYMTAFMGMKMHEDEYKILGYEVLIDSLDIDRQALDYEINREITRILDGYFDAHKLVDKFDALIRLDALPALQKNYIDRWTKLCSELNINQYDLQSMRIALGYYVQSILQGVVLTLVKIFRPKNLICSGGVFYNVKLNRQIVDFIDGKLCVFPLAGDQGCALGLYARSDSNSLKWPGHFNWGRRPRVSSEFRGLKSMGHDIIHLMGQDPVEFVGNNLQEMGVVNIVRGSMEFGPRAMCNTSTLAIPKPSMVNLINKMNNRNTVMPMAPVMNRAEYINRMHHTQSIHMSEEHMIVALPYKAGREQDILGAAHPYPTEYTGRPQVIDGDPLLDKLFLEFPVLINTSFNYHGRPIAFSYRDVMFSHEKQHGVFPVKTIYVEEE